MTVALAGLGPAEVEERIARGEVNGRAVTRSRSVGGVIRANVLTPFNAVLGALLAIILWVGPIQDALFGISILVNTLVGIIQELRAKRALDRLVVVSAPSARVVRSGVVGEIPPDQIVKDDVFELRAGDPILVDGEVLTSAELEIDESLLSGESVPVAKAEGATVLSGSFVVAGTARARATQVGESAWARALAAEAKKPRPARSDLRAAIDKIIKTMAWVVPPIAVLLTMEQLAHTEAGWRDAIRGSIAALESMVPQGLVLLTSVALAVAIVRLGRRGVLVQELSAVEILARVDVVCIDKTGTLTQGGIHVEDIVPLGDCGVPIDDLRGVVGAMGWADPNLAPRSGIGIIDTVPFSSARGWSAVMTQNRGGWVLGSPEVVLAKADMTEAHRLMSTGRRVLALARAIRLPSSQSPLPDDLAPAALVVLGEKLRTDVTATMRFFDAEGVALKIISGDDARTVSALARAAGVPNADRHRDGRTLSQDSDRLADDVETNAVFGRVSPHQKQAMIRALHQRGHVVAMIGDGVNDVLALKEADLGIAVRTATPAARAIAKILLLDGFSSLPAVVAEGRRVIGSVEHTAGLFLSKTCAVLLLTIAVTVVELPFPLLPRHMTIAGTISIGVPAFVLALAPNAARARPGFLRRVLRVAVPAGCVAGAATLATFVFARLHHPGDLMLARTASLLVISACGTALVVLLPGPSRVLRAALGAGSAVALALTLELRPARMFLALEWPSSPVWTAIVVATCTAFALLLWLLPSLSGRPRPYRDKH